MSKKKDSKTTEDDFAFDMYRHLSRWDVILSIVFVVAFLIFTLALFLYPQVV